MARIDLAAVPRRTGTIYPPPYDREVAGRSSLRLGEAGKLTQFGVNLVYLEPGAKSSLRHWHAVEDEFLMVTQGVLMLHMDEGETEMLPGDCAAFPAGVENGHCVLNRSKETGAFLVVGSKAPREGATYPDLDFKAEIAGGKARFFYRDGTDWTGPR